MRDPHFARLAAAGRTQVGEQAIPALPVPFASLVEAGGTRAAPELGEANEAYGFAPPSAGRSAKRGAAL